MNCCFSILQLIIDTSSRCIQIRQHCLKCIFVDSDSISQTFSNLFIQIQVQNITNNKTLTCLSLCFCAVIHNTDSKSSRDCQCITIDCCDFHYFSFRANFVFIVFKTRNHIILSKNSFSRCDCDCCVKHSNICSQFRLQVVFIRKHIFWELHYKLWMSSSSVWINQFRLTISDSAVEILFDCESSSSWTSFNVHAVIVNETREFASNECADCEIVFGFAVSSETQLSTALSIEIVFQVFAVAFTISRMIVSQLSFLCSIVKI